MIKRGAPSVAEEGVLGPPPRRSFGSMGRSKSWREPSPLPTNVLGRAMKPAVRRPGSKGTMTTICENCGLRPATVRDFAMRSGTWVEAEVCDKCARRRRSAPLTLVGSALAAVALAVGTTYALDRLQGANERDPSASDRREWAKRLRSGTPTLSSYSRDLTAAAKAGELDPVIGREDEIDRVIAILSRRSKNNPVLVGDPGVGKTAVVEGLAQWIAG